MMRKIKLPMLVLVACFLFGSCALDNDSPNFHFTTLNVVEASLPEFFELNKTYNIDVTYVRPNGCTFFDGFDISKVGQTDRDVAVIGTVITDEDTACTQAVEEVVATLPFQVIFTEDYNFRFYAGTDANENPIYLEYTVPVEVDPTN